MADFVATGMTRLDAVVPDELNQRALAQLDRAVASFPYGTPLGDLAPSGTALRRARRWGAPSGWPASPARSRAWWVRTRWPITTPSTSARRVRARPSRC